MLIGGRKNAADKQPLKKLLSRGIRTPKNTTFIVSCTQQYSRKVTRMAYQLIRALSRLLRVCLLFGSKTKPPYKSLPF